MNNDNKREKREEWDVLTSTVDTNRSSSSVAARLATSCSSGLLISAKTLAEPKKHRFFRQKKTTKIQRQNKICPRNEITSRYLIFRWIILQEDRLHLAVDSSASNGSIRRCLCVQMWRRNSRMNSENSAICRCCRSDQLSLFVAAILCRNSPSAVNVMSLVVVEGTRTR